MRKEFRSLVSLEEARSFVLSRLPLIYEEIIPLENALGRVLAEKVISDLDVPGFHRASMDGYAIHAKDTLDAREDRALELELAGSVPMGSIPEIQVAEGEAVEVSTGSMMPAGADAVVMIEYTEVQGDSVLIRRPVYSGENVQAAASDIAFGEVVLYPGTVLTALDVGLLAALGRDQIKARSLKVGVASTGNELVPPGKSLASGQIYDINSYSVAAAVQECGAAPLRYGILPDQRKAMAETLSKMAQECGLVLVSGSTSAGAGDMIYQVLDEIGETVFHGVNLKPGKPTLFGMVEATPCLGLPGYPTSALTIFELLAAPAIRKALGLRSRRYRAKGRLSRSVRSEGRQQMLAVGISGDVVYPLDKGSGSITTLAQADGVIEIPSDVEYLDRGDEVEVQMLGERLPDLTVAGESCPVVETILEAMPYQVRYLAIGSRRGMISLEDCAADLACISCTSGKELDVPEGCILVKGYTRELGLMTRDEKLFSREALSDSPILGWSMDSNMDQVLRKALEEMGLDWGDMTIEGRAKSHSAVAASVASGRALLGFGARASAEVAQLLFKGLAWDRIDFVVKQSALRSEAVGTFISCLRSDALRCRLPGGVSINGDAYSRQLPSCH